MSSSLRIVQTIAGLCVTLPLAVACGNNFNAYDSAGIAQDDVPNYQVIGEDPRDDNVVSGISADLLVPNATVNTAKAALADYIEQNSDRDLIEAKVITSEDAGTYVCNVRYFADDQTAQIFRGTTFDSYPAAEWNCPNP